MGGEDRPPRFQTALNIGEAIIVKTWIEEMFDDGVKVVFRNYAKSQRKLCCEGYFDYTMINLRTGRAEQIPAEIREKRDLDDRSGGVESAARIATLRNLLQIVGGQVSALILFHSMRSPPRIAPTILAVATLFAGWDWARAQTFNPSDYGNVTLHLKGMLSPHQRESVATWGPLSAAVGLSRVMLPATRASTTSRSSALMAQAT